MSDIPSSPTSPPTSIPFFTFFISFLLISWPHRGPVFFFASAVAYSSHICQDFNGTCFSSSPQLRRHGATGLEANSYPNGVSFQIRISPSDLQDRHTLERNIRQAALLQFESGKTGVLYNISTPNASAVTAQAMRLRSGSFRRYGALINEFSIPNGSILRPDPKRILIVYTHITNPNLFGDLPQGYVVVSPVLSMLAYDYDAAAVGRNQSVEALSVSFGSDSMTIQFAEQGPGSFMCASFDMNSVNVTYNPFQGACQVSEFGTFALVSNSSLLERGPASATTTVSGNLPSSPSHRWKIVVGSVVGVVATLALVGLFACGFTSYRRKTKFARMQYYADHGETLQTTTVGNSRVPAAGSTRTLSSIVKEYSG